MSPKGTINIPGSLFFELLFLFFIDIINTMHMINKMLFGNSNNWNALFVFTESVGSSQQAR